MKGLYFLEMGRQGGTLYENLKKGKSAGPDGIINEPIKCGVPQMTRKPSLTVLILSK